MFIGPSANISISFPRSSEAERQLELSSRERVAPPEDVSRTCGALRLPVAATLLSPVPPSTRIKLVHFITCISFSYVSTLNSYLYSVMSTSDIDTSCFTPYFPAPTKTTCSACGNNAPEGVQYKRCAKCHHAAYCCKEWYVRSFTLPEAICKLRLYVRKPIGGLA